MIHRVKKEDDMHRGKWNGLGGKMISGESPEECAIREIKEEAGLLVSNPILKGLITFPSFQPDQDWYAFVFLVNKFEGELIESDEGILCWIADDELLDLNLWEGDRIFIPWLEREGFFSAKFVYDRGELQDYSVQFY